MQTTEVMIVPGVARFSPCRLQPQEPAQ